MLADGTLVPPMSGRQVDLSLPLEPLFSARGNFYFAIRAIDNEGQSSPSSGVATAALGSPCETCVFEGITVGALVGIIIGTMCGVFLIAGAVVGGRFFWKKNKAKKSAASGGGGGQQS